MKYSAFISAFIIGVCIFSWVVSLQQGNYRLRCSLDGSEIQPLYEVEIIHKDRFSRSFACVVNASIWFSENNEEIFSVLVTDEVTGEKIRAEDAFYVVSEVVTHPYSGNSTHVFSEKTRARTHARQFNGKLVKNPFQVEEKIRVFLTEHRPAPQSGPGILFSSYQNPLTLPAKTALINKQNCSCLPQEYPTILSAGYSNPPHKPPRILV